MADGRLEGRFSHVNDRQGVVGLKVEEGPLVSVRQDGVHRSQVRLKSSGSILEQERRGCTVQGHSIWKCEVLGRGQVVVKALELNFKLINVMRS